MSVKYNISTLGIPKSQKCPGCHRTIYRTNEERHNMAECMMSNCKGLWCLEHCSRCGYASIIYPVAINGIKCTEEECKQLFEEIKSFNRKMQKEEVQND